MEILVLIVGLAALVWGAVLLRQGGLLAGALLVLVTGICFGHPFFHVSLGPLPVTLDRVLLGALIGLAIVARRLGGIEPKPLTGADAALIAFLGLLALSTLTHDWHTNKSMPLTQLLFFYLLPLGLYWVVRQAPVSERAVWGFFGGCALFGIYLAATSIAETRGMAALVFPRYIASPSYVEFFGRGRGPLLNPAGSGILQGLCLCSALVWWPRLPRWGRAVLILSLPLYALGIYATYTRSAWLGAMLGVAVVVGLALPRSWRVAALGTIVLAAVPLVAANWERLLSFKRDKNLSAEEAAESAKLRPILAVVAWHMFLDRPFLGCGYGQYILECRPYLTDRSGELPLEKVRPYVQHNVLLALLVETGLVGASLFLATMLLWLRQAWRLWKEPRAPPAYRQLALVFLGFVGVWLPNAMFQDVQIIPMVNMLLLFMAALNENLWLQVKLAPAAAAEVALPRIAVAGSKASLGPSVVPGSLSAGGVA